MVKFNVDEVIKDAEIKRALIGNPLPAPGAPRESTFHPFSIPQRPRAYPSLSASPFVATSTTTAPSHSTFSNQVVSGPDQVEAESSSHSGESGPGLAEVAPDLLDA